MSFANLGSPIVSIAKRKMIRFCVESADMVIILARIISVWLMRITVRVTLQDIVSLAKVAISCLPIIPVSNAKMKIVHFVISQASALTVTLDTITTTPTKDAKNALSFVWVVTPRPTATHAQLVSISLRHKK